MMKEQLKCSVGFLLLIIYLKTGGCLELDNVFCLPPDYPTNGYYEFTNWYYEVGDIVHYYCNSTFMLSGNVSRKCEDTTDWSGDVPFCDPVAEFSSVNQSSTTEPKQENCAEKAIDSLDSVCSETGDGPGQYWMGMLKSPGRLISVAVFVPRGLTAYQVMALKKDGEQFSCGNKITFVDAFDWTTHICPETKNTDVVAVKIQSLSDASTLKLCEVRPYVTRTPDCKDPRLKIPFGQLEINRTHATLHCVDNNVKGSEEDSIECYRKGVWTSKSLYCKNKLKKGDLF